MILELLLGLVCQCSQCVCEDPEPVPTPAPGQCESPLAFTGGTLWKPQGDHSGKLVVLLAEQHDYDSCKVKRKDGSWEELTYTGRSNGNRQTWRGDAPGGPTYAGKNAGGGVDCDNGCFFPLPGRPRDRHE